MAKVTYQKELFRNIMAELPELFLAHYNEADKNNHDLQLNPNWNQYIVLENSGVLHVLTARSGGGLVGYYVVMVIPSLHYQQAIVSATDLIYVKPEYRPGGTGIRLIKRGEQMVKELGATRAYLVTKANSDANMVVGRLGYDLVEQVHLKVL